MVNKDDVLKVVKAYLPKAEQEKIERIVTDVTQDAEMLIYSLIRRAVTEEKDKLID